MVRKEVEKGGVIKQGDVVAHTGKNLPRTGKKEYKITI